MTHREQRQARIAASVAAGRDGSHLRECWGCEDRGRPNEKGFCFVDARTKPNKHRRLDAADLETWVGFLNIGIATLNEPPCKVLHNV
jgi:hypothetical protein